MREKTTILADFIGGPLHMQSRSVPDSVPSVIEAPVMKRYWECDKPVSGRGPDRVEYEVALYRLVIQTSTFCVYVGTDIAITPARSDVVSYCLNRIAVTDEALFTWAQGSNEMKITASTAIERMLNATNWRSRVVD